MRAIPQSYLGDLSDAQWEVLPELIPPSKPGGRPRSVDIRALRQCLVLCAVYGLLDVGCPMITQRGKRSISTSYLGVRMEHGNVFLPCFTNGCGSARGVTRLPVA